MFDLLELLLGLLDVLDVFAHGGDLLRCWRFCATFGTGILVAVLLHHHLPWETANALVSIPVGLAGLVTGVFWEGTHRKL